MSYPQVCDAPWWALVASIELEHVVEADTRIGTGHLIEAHLGQLWKQLLDPPKIIHSNLLERSNHDPADTPSNRRFAAGVSSIAENGPDPDPLLPYRDGTVPVDQIAQTPCGRLGTVRRA